MTRQLLEADGLVFNGELNTWLDPFTYTDISNFPGISKCKDVLYEFMDAQALEIEVLDYISWIQKLAKNGTSATKQYADNLYGKINACTSSEELHDLLNSADANQMFWTLGYKSNDDKTVINITYELDDQVGFGKFSKAMGYADKFLKAANLTVESTVDLMELSSKLAVYARYTEFLREIAKTKGFPWEMRLAAAQILYEIDEGAWGKIKEIAIDIIELSGVSDKVIDGDKILESVLGKAGATSFNEIILVINLTSWCINQVVDIGSIVKGQAYAEAYGYLGVYYCKKLNESKAAFLQDQSAENAWDFFENYNILYTLRYKGEEAALKAFTLKGGTGLDMSLLGFMVKDLYADANACKEDVINSTLEQLEESKFILPDNIKIPESVQYVSKTVVSCPVDVEVYAPDGTYITVLVDGVESDLTNEYGRFSVVYRPYTGDYAKIICLLQAGDFHFRIIGKDNGLVDFKTARMINNAVETYSFTNEPTAYGTIFEICGDKLTADGTYDIDTDNDGNFERQGATLKNTDSSHVALNGMNLSASEIVLGKGESTLLTVSITPNTATNQNVIWLTADSDVASVKNGKVTAHSAGTTIIHCIPQDDPSLIATCKITVEEVSKTAVSISGVIVQENIIYTGGSQPGFTGTPTSAYTGDYDILYTGRNGTKYGSATPPTDAGDYTVTIKIPDSDATYAGSIALEFTIAKAAQGAPATPEMNSKTSTSVSLKAVEPNSNGAIAEYSKDGGTTWQSSPTFTGLSANTEYNFIVRYSETKNFAASDVSTALKVQTSSSNSTTTPTTPSVPSYNPGNTYVPPTYTITTPSVTGGKVSVSPAAASSGSTVTITAMPDTGYALTSLIVSDVNGRTIDLTDKGNGQYSFKMPNGRVSIDVEFKPVSIDVPWNNPFVDVSIGDWYYDAVKFANQNGLMNGVGNGLFAPNAQLSRAMLAEILYNNEGRPAVIGGSTFADVQPGAWYADAVAWASGEGIVTGYGNGLFGPDDDITREQVAVMLYRYAGSPVPPNLLLNFTDAYKVSNWAQDAVRWAVDQGILNGKGNGILDPTGKANRAETAQIFKNYLEK